MIELFERISSACKSDTAGCGAVCGKDNTTTEARTDGDNELIKTTSDNNNNASEEQRDQVQVEPVNSDSTAETQEEEVEEREADDLARNREVLESMGFNIRSDYDEGHTQQKALLHGLLHVKIICCRNLRNFDGLRGLGEKFKTLQKLSRDKSDPFVIVKGGDHRFVKTRVINNDLNPVWNENFYIPVAHYVSGLFFEVRDMDYKIASECLGRHSLPLADLLKFEDDECTIPKRVGIHKIVNLNENPKHGTLEYFVEYVPAEMISAQLEVPGTYFKKRMGNKVKLYVNADDGIDVGTPPVTYGGVDDNDKVWNPQRLWRDIYDAMCAAKHFIYITGWAVDTSQCLLRGKEREKVLTEGRYSPYIGELLKQKADEGVAVNMLVWDDATSNFALPGMMGTHDEETEAFFKGSKVTLKLAPMLGEQQNAMHEKAGKYVMFTHHQKLVILDTPTEDGSGKCEPYAFVGGIDLTDGRWDNARHPLFRSLGNDHVGDAYNGCFSVDVANNGPREPWHDIHSSVRGPQVLDVLKNFTERWYKQAADAVGSLIDIHRCEDIVFPEHKDEEEWCTQLFRSIDSRTAVFDKGRLATFTDQEVDEIEGVEFVGDEFGGGKNHGHHHKFSKFVRKAKGKSEGKVEKYKEPNKSAEKERSFEARDAVRFKFTTDLDLKKGRDIDSSVHSAFIHHIRRAEHSIYIESQYFLGSSHMWSRNNSTKCGNLVASEVMLKICQKIEAGERFTAYILLPMWPEGIPESGSVQAILRWQRLTMESMYKRVAKALKKRRKSAGTTVRHPQIYSTGSNGGMQMETSLSSKKETPRDYLNFYCLANRETKEGDTAPFQAQVNTIGGILAQTRRHQIYVHSKMLIADDTVALIGSSNINQRSLDGARDSEILMGSWQPAHVATKRSSPKGDIHGFRMHCFATIMGRMEDVFREPSSLACVRRVNQIAEENWRQFVALETSEMNSHLVPYPIHVKEDGSVRPRPELEGGCFPDTKAKVTGTKSSTLPEILTT